MSYSYVKDKSLHTDGPPLPPGRRRRQRSDAKGSISAITDAAIEALNADPRASMEDIARAAGVTRQTVYAHFPSRDALLRVIIERASAEITAAFEVAGFEQSPPAEALVQLLEAGWQATARYPFVWNLPAVSPEEDASRHAPIVGRMLDLIRRGQESGDLDDILRPDWLLTASMAIGRAAQDEVVAGRMSLGEATRAVHVTFLRLLGIDKHA